MSTFTLSIEATAGQSFQHHFHLGTIESVARDCAADIFRARVRNSLPVVTVALIREGRIFDVFDGRWNSDR